MCSYVNDLHSFAKETADRDPLNIVTVLAQELDLDMGSAAAAAAEEFDKELRLLEEDCREVRAEFPTDSTFSVTGGLLDWVHGNSAWTGMCARYHPRR
ncbi:hypothetical protein GCM10010272_64670 [Streptomyces lateritius]|nr:hypothetical protein GCM10010272_64670 [Streptomyces lateritius]